MNTYLLGSDVIGAVATTASAPAPPPKSFVDRMKNLVGETPKWQLGLGGAVVAFGLFSVYKVLRHGIK